MRRCCRCATVGAGRRFALAAAHFGLMVMNASASLREMHHDDQLGHSKYHHHREHCRRGGGVQHRSGTAAAGGGGKATRLRCLSPEWDQSRYWGCSEAIFKGESHAVSCHCFRKTRIPSLFARAKGLKFSKNEVSAYSDDREQDLLAISRQTVGPSHARNRQHNHAGDVVLAGGDVLEGRQHVDGDEARVLAVTAVVAVAVSLLHLLIHDDSQAGEVQVLETAVCDGNVIGIVAGVVAATSRRRNGRVNDVLACVDTAATSEIVVIISRGRGRGTGRHRVR